MFSMSWRIALSGLLAAQLAACGGKKDGGEGAETPKTNETKSATSEKPKADPKADPEATPKTDPNATANTAKADPNEKKPATPVAKLTGPIAKVNGVTLESEEFNRKYEKMTRAFTTRGKEIPDTLAKRYKESILKQLVEKELLKQKIKAESIVVSPEEIATEFEKYKKMFRTDENFERYLKSSQISEEQIKDNVRHNQSVNKLLEKVSDVKISADEAQKYYDEHKDRYAVKEQVRASHILFKVPKNADEAAAAEAKKKADEAYKQATKAKADFAELAKKLSQGPTAPRGGDLSFFPKGRMVKEFEEVAFKMKKGDISKPVKTQFGWHVIKVTDRKDARQRPFDEVKDAIEKNLKARKTRKAKQDLLTSLRTSAKIEVLVDGISLKTTPAARPAPVIKPTTGLKPAPKKAP